jgi:hypothetical protein
MKKSEAKIDTKKGGKDAKGGGKGSKDKEVSSGPFMAIL